MIHAAFAPVEGRREVPAARSETLFADAPANFLGLAAMQPGMEQERPLLRQAAGDLRQAGILLRQSILHAGLRQFDFAGHAGCLENALLGTGQKFGTPIVVSAADFAIPPSAQKFLTQRRKEAKVRKDSERSIDREMLNKLHGSERKTILP
jgi:hypothetical protein